MRRTILTPADLAGAALDDLKQWLAIRSNADDAALTALLAASCEACEGFTGTMPLTQACEEIIPARGSWQALTTRPVHAITEVAGLPAEGSAFALPSGNYAIELEADGTALVRVMHQGAAGRVRMRFLAGLAPEWGLLPETLRHGVLRLAAHLHRARDSGDGGDMGAPPAAVTALWRPWRRMRVA
jgi:uncharacterized phiE125 gp8 family phage protein